MPPSVDKKPPLRMAEALAALSFATDLGEGQPIGHVQRTCFLSMHVGRAMGLTANEQADLYYAALLMHSGCTAASPALAEVSADDFALRRDLSLRSSRELSSLLNGGSETRHALVEAFDGTCEVAARVAHDIGLGEGVEAALRHRLERWDGRGPLRVAGVDIPQASRILQAAMRFEKVYAVHGWQAALAGVNSERDLAFDPHVVDAIGEVTVQSGIVEAFNDNDRPASC